MIVATMDDYIDAALRAYLVCALWTETDYSDDGENGVPMDEDHEVDDIDPDAVVAQRAELVDFLSSNWSDVRDMDPDQVGHDFLLTRNGHGAGFWDRGDGARGDRLTEACRPYGTAHFYVGDDGAVYAE